MVQLHSEHVLRSTEPAIRFDRAYPIGNGRLGGMIYGNLAHDHLLLNESTMWSGSPQQSDRTDALQYLPEIRRLLAAGENMKAQSLFREHFTCLGKGTNYANGATVPFGCYQVLGRLNMNFFHTLSYSQQFCDDCQDYERTLDISSALGKVAFTTQDVHFCREYIASNPDQVIAVHLSSSKLKNIHAGISLDRDERFRTEILPGNIILMTGALNDGNDGNGLQYACAVKVITTGGEVFSDSGKLFIRGADEALILISAATNMQGFLGRNLKDERKTALAEVENASKKTWEQLYASHLEDYQRYYSRMDISFEKAADFSKQELRERLCEFTKTRGENGDTGLLELYFNYSRYLLIACSREGGMPPNLQGIWANEIQTPWNCDWHLNAQQIIYWSAEIANLSEMHQSFLDLTRVLVEPGSKTAKAYYGTDGWLVHTCVNPWGFTSPCEDAAWGSTIGSGAWQCHHLWDHYLYTQDVDYLRSMYPVMKGAAVFYRNMLVKEPKHGWLVTSPSSSPENLFVTSAGEQCALCMGPTYDTELLRSLFTYCINAQKVLHDDESFAAELQEILAQMAPIRVSSDGRIMEWLEEYPEALPHHRHVSHLWGLYPGALIDREETPELAEAAAHSLIERGKTTAGWAVAWRMCLWAKLGNGAEAYRLLLDALSYATSYNLFDLAYHCNETVPVPRMPDIDHNRYPFQIDGNMGCATGMALMLLDDTVKVNENGEMSVTIRFLPALPKQLKSGSIRGLKAKGNLTLDFSWENGVVTHAQILAMAPVLCRIILNGNTEERKLATGETVTLL